ncbi:hypothetical protein D3C78_1017950 [compost metagenome]
MGDHQMGDAQHIQRRLRRHRVGFDIAQGLALQIRQVRRQRQHALVQVEGNVEPEGRTAVQLAVETDIAAHLFHQLLSDHQPQAGTAVAARNAGIRLTERLEQL